MHHSLTAALFLLLLAPPALAHGPEQHPAGIGEPGQAAQVTRSIAIGMNDKMRFSPASISVKRGETIRFVVTNNGQRVHEFMLGDIRDLQAHAEVMKKHPEMIHDEPNAITVEAGQSGELIWRFTQDGKVDFACLLPGHFEAGMKGQIAARR